MHHKLCILPWIHMHPFPNGNVALCCYADHYNIGNLQNQTIMDIANSEKMSEIRRQFLTGEHGPEIKEACRECWLKEDVGVSSGRQWFNNIYKDSIEDIIKDTNADGTLSSDFKFKYMSLRISNLCNYSCRSCHSTRSSTIAIEKGISNPVQSILDVKPDYMSDLLPYMKDVETALFIGGESILIPQHEEILEEIIRIGRQNQVRIDYFCNMSKLKYQQRSLIEYSKIFNNFNVVASIDAIGDRLELLRNGSNWDTVLNNLTLLRDNNVNLKIWSTIGNINAHHAPDMFSFLIGNNFIKGNNFEFTIVNEPKWMNPRVMPQILKEEIAEKYKKFIQKINESNYDIDKKLVSDKFNEFIDFIMSVDSSNEIPLFLEMNDQYDRKRNQNLFEVFPELIHFKKYM